MNQVFAQRQDPPHKSIRTLKPCAPAPKPSCMSSTQVLRNEPQYQLWLCVITGGVFGFSCVFLCFRCGLIPGLDHVWLPSGYFIFFFVVVKLFYCFFSYSILHNVPVLPTGTLGNHTINKRISRCGNQPTGLSPGTDATTKLADIYHFICLNPIRISCTISSVYLPGF